MGKGREFLFNRIDKQILKKQLMEESFSRVTVSFYRYVILENPQDFRDNLYHELNRMQTFGRIYIAREGINAQMSVPKQHWGDFKKIRSLELASCSV